MLTRRREGERTLPLPVEPSGETDASATALAAWVDGNREQLDAWLHRDGAVLLRGFSVDSAEALHTIASAASRDLMSYVGGDSPRSSVGDRVYTSTEFPPHLEIGLHNELSYTRTWPERVFFCCLVAAASGGETPIADSRTVYRRMDPTVRDRFASRGVTYRQHLRDDGTPGPGKSWQESFETAEREDVERICDAQSMAFQWTEHGLRTRLNNPGVCTHPVTGETCWFNQADLWHASFDSVKAGVEDAADAFGSHATYGDGGEIPIGDLEAVRSAYRSAEVLFPWRAGDLLVLDNRLAMHGRRPFTGERRVLVALA